MEKKTTKKAIFLNFLLFLGISLLFSSDAVNISVNTATPLLPLSLLVAFSCYYSLNLSAVFGFLSGAVLDSVATGSYCFNTIFMLILGVLANLLLNTVFNKNWKAVFALCSLLSVLYYLVYWVIFIAFSLDFDGNTLYLLQYALPSSLYTGVVSLIFYFIYKFPQGRKAEY